MKDTWEKCLKSLIRLHPRFPLCYAEAAMDTPKGHRPLKPRLCRSPQLTPERLEGPGASESEPRMLLKTQGVGKITCESGFGLKAMRAAARCGLSSGLGGDAG